MSIPHYQIGLLSNYQICLTMSKFLVLSSALILFVSTLFAQRPIPAPAQTNSVLILGATAHLGNGQTIANSAIAFEKGKLTLVADATLIRFDRSRFGKIYDAAGKHVYPGFIAPNTTLGLTEIDALKPTRDFSELGTYTPQLRTIVAYNTDSDIIPTVRSNGILMAQVAPDGSGLLGTSSIVQLDAWNWEDATYRADDGVWMDWPNPRAFSRFGSNGPQFKKSEDYDKQVQANKQYFEEARAYSKQPNPAVKNLAFEAMRGLFDKTKSLFILANTAQTIEEAVLFAEGFGVRVVIVGATDSWLVADFLKEHQVPVILGATQAIPPREDDDLDQRFKTPAMLQEKGVLFALSDAGSWKQRNLPFQAGQACGYGLSVEQAISALTLNTAKILGIDDRCGSLEEGKDATLFISEGDALDMRSCIVTAAFIQGREINLDNKHKQLARRFVEKYKQN